jgi:hypothetical protein
MSRNKRKNIGALVIIDLMATSFGVVVLLLLVSLLQEEREIIDNAPVVGKIFSAEEKFKIQTLQITHDSERIKRSIESPYYISLYDDRIEYFSPTFENEISLKGEYAKSTDTVFRDFLASIKKRDSAINIYIFENGLYYKTMDLINAHGINGYFIHAPTTPHSDAILSDHENRIANDRASAESQDKKTNMPVPVSTPLLWPDKKQTLENPNQARNPTNQADKNNREAEFFWEYLRSASSSTTNPQSSTQVISSWLLIIVLSTLILFEFFITRKYLLK